MRGIAVCVLMLTLSLWTVQQGNALPWNKEKTFSTSQFPQYRLLHKTPHFEYRSYEPSTLMSTGVPVNSSITDLYDKLTNLFRFFDPRAPRAVNGVVTVDRINIIHGEPCDYFGSCNGQSCMIDYYTKKLYCNMKSGDRYRPYINKDCSYEGLKISDLEGYRCVFPFRYKGVWFHACTAYNADSGKLWCAHTTYYRDGTGEWGYCPEVRQSTLTNCFDDGIHGVELPELNVAYVLPREMEAEALASSPGNDVTVTSVPAGNICSRDLETADMTYEMILATASELVKHCRQAGHNHEIISLVKYLDKDKPRVEIWFL